MRRILFILLAATLSAGWAYASATATATTAAPAGDDTDESDLKYSDDETDYWYAIFNAGDRQTEVCVTEAPVDDAGDYPFVLENFSDDNPAQQWKFVQRPGGRVVMVNRASGRFIAPTSLPVDLYNVIQPAESLTLTMGWTLTYLGQGQYTVSAKEDDNIVRYWYAATEGQTPGEYDDSNLLNSGFSWTPVAVDSTPVGIADAQADRLAVYVVGGRIVVDGATDYAVYTAGGIRVDPESLDKQLAASGCDDRRSLWYHRQLLAGELPLSIGGGIGQSRMSMLLLGKAHIGEVQCSTWDAETVRACEEAGVMLL